MRRIHTVDLGLFLTVHCMFFGASNSVVQHGKQSTPPHFKQSTPPHFIVVVIDDLGWNDVPWNNPDSLAVNLGFYARQGVILDRHYVHPKCSPSRAALLTGRYAWKMGRQRGAIERYQPTGLSTEYTLLPERLKEAGYSTHAVGKWHLGFCNEKYLPTRRGFDTFFGVYQQSVNYRTRMIACASYKFRQEMMGYDLRRNESVSFDYSGVYSPVMYSEEAQSIIRNHDASKPLFLYLPFMALHTPIVGKPPKKLRKIVGGSVKGNVFKALKMDNLEDDSEYDEFDEEEGFAHDEDMRDILLAATDASIHKLIQQLKKSGLYDNSVILITTDNGGGPWWSNSPLKGSKETLYEGGIRAASFLLSPLLSNPGRRYSGLVHVVDWFPTFLHLAGLETEPAIDGVNQWEAINLINTPNRTNIIHNIDENHEKRTFQATIQDGRYKLIWGQHTLLKRSQPQYSRREELFDLEADPNEEKKYC